MCNCQNFIEIHSQVGGDSNIHGLPIVPISIPSVCVKLVQPSLYEPKAKVCMQECFHMRTMLVFMP